MESMYDHFFIPYVSTLGLIPEEDEQPATGLDTLCVKTVRIVRGLLNRCLDQFPGLTAALTDAFTAYDNGTLRYDMETGRIIATT